jgi:hypothetical protein
MDSNPVKKGPVPYSLSVTATLEKMKKMALKYLFYVRD